MEDDRTAREVITQSVVAQVEKQNAVFAQNRVEDKPKFQNLRSLVGLRVVVQEKNGPIVTGLFSDFSAGEGYLRIADASVTGRSKKVSPPFVLVHFTAIAHIHPEVEAEKV